MAHDEIDGYKRKLTEYLQRMRDPGVKPDDSELLRELHELALQVGACPVVSVRNASGSWRWDKARAPEYAYSIHFALQTASMIDACQTAAKNHEIALQAQRDARTSHWIAVGALFATVALAVAAWVFH